MKENEIWMDRDLSSTMKGILILLIVFAHNHFLISSKDIAYNWFYSFHVSSFFILPFFYENHKKLNLSTVRDLLIKSYVPYVIFAALCFVVYHVFLVRDDYTILLYFKGILMGNPFYLKQNVGFIFIWFLAVYACVSLMLLIYRNSKQSIQYLWIIITIGIFLFIGKGAYSLFYRECPMGIALSFYYFGAGICTYLLLKYLKYIDTIALVLFVIFSVVYFMIMRNEYISKILMITGFLSVYRIAKELKKMRILIFIGKNSFYIYMFHIFVYNACYLFCPKSELYGWLFFVISLPICLILGFVLQKMSKLHDLIFPHDWQTLKSVFSK